jgi:hypothetical protein
MRHGPHPDARARTRRRVSQAALLESCSSASDGSGGGEEHALPTLLRRKRGCALTKGHLLALCRVWGYRSAAWCAGERARAACTYRLPRELTVMLRRPSFPCFPWPCACRQRKANLSASRKTKRSSGPPPALPAPKAMCAAPALVARVDVGALRQLATRSAVHFAGHAARAAAQAHNQVHFSEPSLLEYSNLERVCRALALRFAAQLCAQQQWGAALLCARRDCLGGDGAAALAVLPYVQAEAPATGALQVMRATMKAAHLLWETNQQRTLYECANTLSPPLQLAFEEYKTALDAGFSFAAHAELLLARLRVEGSACELACAAEAVVAECEAFAISAASAFAERARWSAEALNGGVATNRMLFHDGNQVTSFFGAAWSDTASLEGEGFFSGGHDDHRCCAAPAVACLAGAARSMLVQLP